MTGARFNVKIDDSELKAGFGLLREATGDLRPAMDEIGNLVVAHTLLRFERQRDPEGNPWQPLAPATLLRRARRRRGPVRGVAQILQDSGRLRLSIVHRAGPNAVSIGTNVIYAAIHQRGGQAGRGLATRIPARPFLGLDAADREDIPAVVARRLAEALR